MIERSLRSLLKPGKIVCAFQSNMSMWHILYVAKNEYVFYCVKINSSWEYKIVRISEVSKLIYSHKLQLVNYPYVCKKLKKEK